MSKLFKHLTAYHTNERAFVQMPIMNMVDSDINVSNVNTATFYDVKVTLGSRVIISEKDRLIPNYRSTLIRDIYRPLAEEVFGEFRKPLIEAQLAIMQGKLNDAKGLIDYVLYSMFDVLQQDKNERP